MIPAAPALVERLELLAESALEVAVETGDPIGLGLAREIEENASEELAERLMDRCEEARSLPLREVGLAANARKRNLFLQRHPPPQGLLALLFRRWRRLPEPVAREKARLANNLGNRLSDLGRREEALQATQEAVRILSPSFLRLPAAFDSWMQIMVGNYRRHCEALGREPDAELLRPIEERLAGGEKAEPR